MNFKDKLKDSQTTGSSSPQLNISKRVDIKEIDGKAQFVVYNKETEKNEVIPSPITGILIGEAMQMSSYSDNLGSKGGTYQSSYYFHNSDVIALFAPTAKGYDIVAKGTPEEVAAFISKESTSKDKKRRVLFILTSEGLVALTTNLTIAIDQKKGIQDHLSSRLLVLTADTYEENVTPISKQAKEYLGKFRTKNPPKFANMELGNEITEKMWDDWKGSEYVDEFIAFKKSKSDWKAKDKEDEPSPESQRGKQERPVKANGRAYTVPATPTDEMNPPEDRGKKNILPF